MRPKAIVALLDSVNLQKLYPDEIIIVDGSTDTLTQQAINSRDYKNLRYYKVDEQERGLTKQRNKGVSFVGEEIEVVCFLDDDIVLEPDYFHQLMQSYALIPEAIAVGGYITNEIKWGKVNQNYVHQIDEYAYDNYVRKDGSRFVLRKKLGLDANRPPAMLPKFSHGRSVGFLPPSGKIYEVEQFMGGVSSYRKETLNKIKFSTYFEGYGLYEDADFCFRLLAHGKLYVNTAAQCEHHHNPSGRPNQFKYGQMVVRNGWYVWRLRWPDPGFKNILKWHANVLLLSSLRLMNSLSGKNKKQAFTESIGRFSAWIMLFFSKPKIQR